MIELIVLGVGAAAALIGGGAVFGSKRKRTRNLHLEASRESTQDALTAMSDQILDLDPRITIANDRDLKRRFTEASRTYSEVRDAAARATRGHEVADLRIDIAKAQWKLDVIEAELDGEQPPPEPFVRDVTGSAWDSTRGSGGRPT